MIKNCLFVFLFFAINVTQSCEKIDTLSNFNLTEYIKNPWYIQKQQITEYLPLRNNYCVNAMYKVSNKTRDNLKTSFGS